MYKILLEVWLFIYSSVSNNHKEKKIFLQSEKVCIPMYSFIRHNVYVASVEK
jgi:hypothetical protein